MRRRFWILFLLVLGMLACGPAWRRPPNVANLDNPGKAYVCLELPADQMKAAEEAVQMWDKSLSNWKRFIPIASGNDSSCAFWVHETMEDHPKEPTALAWASMIGGREIYMHIGRYEKDTRGILLHELGHALGAQHIAGTLMNSHWFPGAFVCPDVQTVSQVAAYHGINLETLSWCTP